MATIKCLGSSSAGNCFIVECNGQSLVLDLGVSFVDVLSALEYRIENVVGCLVTHLHKDHSASIPNALKYALPVYSCQEVVDKYKGVELLQLGEKKRIGEFWVQPIPIEHNVENYGYVITHPNMGKLVFALDCARFPYKFRNVNHWVIEANYDEDLMLAHACEGIYSQSASGNHLSIEETIETLNINFTEDTKTIILAHLSDVNSDEVDFIKRVKEKLFFSNVYAAKRDFEVFLDNNTF